VPPSRREQRRVAFAGKTLAPGKHVVPLDGPGGEIVATVLVGASAGPRAVVLGGLEPGDSLGLAVTRRVLEALEGLELAGSLVLLPQLARERPFRRSRLAPLVAGAAFVVELRAGEAGWSTVAHLRADLGAPRASRLARAFGAAIVVDARGGSAQLRYEAGERGRWDAAAAEGGAAGVLSLLGSRGIAPLPALRPPLRLIVEDCRPPAAASRRDGGACRAPRRAGAARRQPGRGLRRRRPRARGDPRLAALGDPGDAGHAGRPRRERRWPGSVASARRRGRRRPP
jgi:hypothetical protein